MAKTTVANNTFTVTTTGGKVRVTLDASASTDSDGVVNSYSWALDQYSSPGVDAYGKPSFSSTTAQKPTVDLYAGTYQFGLVVTDDKGKTSARATVKVTVNEQGNAAPAAKVIAPVSVLPGDAVALGGAQSRDPEGKALTYMWTLTPPAGSRAAITNATKSSASFTADTYGAFAVTLQVTDSGGLTDVYSVVITSAVGDVYAAKTTVSTPVSDLYADGSTTVVSVRPKDRNGNLLGKGQQVELALSPASLGTLGPVALAADGYSYQATLTAPTGVGGSVNVVAKVNGVPMSSYASINYTAHGLDLAKSTLQVATHSILVGKKLRVTVVPKDKYGTPLDGSHVVQVINSYGSATDTISVTAPDVNRAYVADLPVFSQYSGALISAKVDNSPINATATVNFIQQGQSVAALTLIDGQGNAVSTAARLVTSGSSVSVKMGGGNRQFGYSVSGPVTSGVVSTVGDSYTFTAPTTGHFAGTYTITLQDVISTQSKTLKVVVPYRVESAARVLLTSSSSGIVVNLYGAASGATFAVALYDGLTPATSSTKATLSAATVSADVNGVASVTVTPTAVTAATPVLVRFTPISGGTPANDAPIMVVPAQTVTVVAKNSNNNKPVSGVAIDLVRPSEFVATATSDAYGKATFSLPKRATASFVVAVGSTSFSPYRFVLAPGSTTA
ncbi:MAG: PKD domain-containing protein, partial [Mariprofundales bacterium]|nr:PKD domain-containing protein [Mariprofundales bacterium]